MDDLLEAAATPTVISVTALNRMARAAIERGIPLTWVAGELSNFKRYDSGHCYFTLKDDAAQVDGVMFRHKAQHLGWAPENGMQVEVRASATVYEARGKYQLVVDAMRRAGLGALYAAFEKRKAALAAEGLFDDARKRALPVFPRTIGVVTSPQAAAWRDVLTTLRRRMPGITVILYPAPVQGEGAAAKIAQAIATAGARAECDVLIVCRGGGSIEDLWAFNEEVVARAVHASPIPVVTGVGHETDFTIADFVADARAPTPTAAAELASPDRAELWDSVRHWASRLRRVMRRGLEARMQHVDLCARGLVHPGERIRNRLANLRHLATRLEASWHAGRQQRHWRLRDLHRQLQSGRPDIRALGRAAVELRRRLRDAGRARLQLAKQGVEGLGASLRHLNPQHVLERGYSITEDACGRIVRDSANLAAGDALTLRFARGSAQAEVRKKD